jgi:hypothetical protein
MMTFLISTPLFACPDLSGNYACKNSIKSFNLGISQRVDKDQTIYNFDEEALKGEFTADGEGRPFTFNHEGMSLEGTMAVTCKENGLDMVFSTNYNGKDTVITQDISKEEDMTVKLGLKVGDEVDANATFKCTLSKDQLED